jgi:hypothetical protein
LLIAVAYMLVDCLLGRLSCIFVDDPFFLWAISIHIHSSFGALAARVQMALRIAKTTKCGLAWI